MNIGPPPCSINRTHIKFTRWLWILAGILVFISAQAEPPATPAGGYHMAEAKWRAISLRDENGQIPDNALLNAVAQKRLMPVDPTAWPGAIVSGPSGRKTAGIDTNSWIWLGPGNIGGRIRSILVHPTNSATMWLGSVCGGLWKTVNNGATWFPLNDFMGNLAIGCMVMDPTDPNTIYAGTGEGFNNFDALRGAGIFKTTNGGTTWTQLASTANSSFYYVNRLSISPTNHLFIIAATGSGIWRSTDGGSSWSQRYSAASILDIEFNPLDGGKGIASGSTFGATGQALYSIDAGVTWTLAAGIPTAGRVEVAYAASNPSIVYASCNTNSGQVYASSDGGVTYSLRNTGNNYLGGQGWYDNTIWVDPTNPNILIVGGTDLWRSTDGGTNFTDIGGYSGGIHPDQHAVVSVPGFDGVSVKTILIGNDGGIFRAADAYAVSSGSGWSTLNHNLGITEFYAGAGNATSGTIVAGAQDNGTVRYTTGNGPQGWTSMFGGDGGFCAADQTDPNYFYGEYVYLQIHRSSNGGASSSYINSGIGDAGVPGGGGDPDGAGPDGDPDASANFIAPFVLDPNNPNTLLAGGSNLWRSVNVKAATPAWSNIKTGANGSFISAIAVAPGNSDVIWVGHNNGDVYSTSNGTAANPTWTRKDTTAPNLPNRTCTRLTIDRTNSSRVFATFGGFNSDNIYRTTDGGLTWANIATGLPAVPVRSLVIAPFNTNYLYAGTEIGVFASANGGSAWSPANDGPASVSTDELFWMNNYLVAVTRGRGVFKILLATAPVIAIASTALTNETCVDSALDPGEMVTVNFTLTNTAYIPSTNLVATLLATNGVLFPSSPQSYGALTSGVAAVTRSFTFMPTGQCGGTITARLQLQDGATSLGTVAATFPLGSVNSAFSENFDSVIAPGLPAGWTNLWTGAGAPWATSTSLPDTSPNSAYAQDPDAISDNSLYSPSFFVSSSTAKLSFRHNYGTEVPYDGGVLEISTNGSAFIDIVTAGGSFATNGYNQTIPNFDNPLANRQAWSGSSGGYVTTIVNLPANIAGKNVQLRWRFGSDTGTSGLGWYVDTVSVFNSVSCCVPPVVAGFSATPTNGLAPLSVTFTNSSTGATTFNWTFGDSKTSTAPAPVNTYSNAGVYTVTLTASGPGGTNTLSRTSYIVVTNLPPIANFVGGPTNGIAPLIVTFTNLSAQATNYSWNFGDGKTSTATNPSNNYSNAGLYSVTLTAVGPGGTNTLVRSNYVLVIAPGVLVVTPSILDFGLLTPNSTAQASLVLSNAGAGALNGTASLSAGAFTLLSGTPFSLASGGTTNALIQFSPVGEGVFSNTVVVASNGGASTNQVFGRAINPPLILTPAAGTTNFIFSFNSLNGFTYVVQYKDFLSNAVWQTSQSIPGDGSTKVISFDLSASAQRFYRLQVQ